MVGLDICVFEKAPVAKLGFVAQFLLMHTSPHLRYYGDRNTAVDPSMPGRIGGDAYAQTPIEIELLPQALRFLIPKKGENSEKNL